MALVRTEMLYAFQCEPRPSGVTLESPGQENIAKILENRAEVAQNHDARKAVSPTPRDWKILPKFKEIEPNFVKITMRVRRSRLLFYS